MKRHVVAVVGGAVAGSEAASLFAQRGALVVVFEQGRRPFGKIEDGLPRWHEKLREKEYARIQENLDDPNIRFVPNTRIGTDVPLADLQAQGFSAIVLANGAWRDRPLPVEGIERFVDQGLVYQNPFVHWFNHAHESDYDGPTFETPEGALVVGGGLASVDVVKILSLTTHVEALKERGVDADIVELEQRGIPKWCAANDIDVDSLAVEPPRLFYRRRMEDMPLASAPPGADEAKLAKVRGARIKIMQRVIDRYRVAFHPLRVPEGVLEDNGRLTGLRFAVTQIVGGRVKPTGETEDVHGPLVISSIGSVPEGIEGIPMKGELYDFANWDTGEVRGLPGVFGLGNVLTGKGNIKDSRINAQDIVQGVLEGYLSEEEADQALAKAHEDVREKAKPVVDAALTTPTVDEAGIEAFVKDRWAAVGYADLKSWLG
ncbi:MAG: FAD-dependent oxidoreductase [Myxococcota bacterium]